MKHLGYLDLLSSLYIFSLFSAVCESTHSPTYSKRNSFFWKAFLAKTPYPANKFHPKQLNFYETLLAMLNLSNYSKQRETDAILYYLNNKIYMSHSLYDTQFV